MLRVVFILIAFSCATEVAKAQSTPLPASPVPPHPPSPLLLEVLKQADCKKLRADAQSGRTLSEVEQKQLVVDCRRQATPLEGIAPPVETYIPPEVLGIGGPV